MNEERLQMLINSYGLSDLLVQLDLEPVTVMEFLLSEGMIEEEKLLELFE